MKPQAWILSGLEQGSNVVTDCTSVFSALILEACGSAHLGVYSVPQTPDAANQLFHSLLLSRKITQTHRVGSLQDQGWEISVVFFICCLFQNLFRKDCVNVLVSSDKMMEGTEVRSLL